MTICRFVTCLGAVTMAAAMTIGAGAGAGAAVADTPAPTTGGTILALGGNSNPDGQDMAKELSGYFSGAPGTAYAGRTFRVVRWPAQTPFTAGSTGLTYDQSQQAGVAALKLGRVSQ